MSDLSDEVLRVARLEHRWTATEGGEFLTELPETPCWFYVWLSLPAHTVRRLPQSAFGRALFEKLFDAASTYAHAHSRGVELATDHELAGWVDANGRIFHPIVTREHGYEAIAYFGVPTRAWADAFDARHSAKKTKAAS